MVVLMVEESEAVSRSWNGLVSGDTALLCFGFGSS